jgi:hypothetical protein
MRAMVVTCGILLGFAAFTPATAAAPFHSGMSAAANELSAIIVVKKKGIPGWLGRRHCPPGHWKKGRC